MNIEVSIVQDYIKHKIFKSNMSEYDKILINKSLSLQSQDVCIQSDDIRKILSSYIPQNCYRHLQRIRKDTNDEIWYAMWRLLLHWHRSELKNHLELRFGTAGDDDSESLGIQIDIDEGVSICGEIVNGGRCELIIINGDTYIEHEIDLKDRNQIDTFINSDYFTK